MLKNISNRELSGRYIFSGIFEKPEDFHQFVKTLLNDKSITQYSRITVANGLKLHYDSVVLHSQESLLDHGGLDFRQKITDLFKELFKDKDSFNKQALRYFTDIYLQNNKDLDFAEQLKPIVRQYVTKSDSIFDEFLKNLIVPYETPIDDHTSFSLSYLAKFLFPTKNEFTKLVEEHTFFNSNYDFIKVLLIENYEAENFQISGSNRKLIVENINT